MSRSVEVGTPTADSGYAEMISYVDWGVVEYGAALERQRELFEALIAKKGRGGFESGAGWLVFCEHPPVYTLGRSGREENLLVGEEWLRERGAALHRVERGGDITFHGPGQVVVYPIVDLGRVGTRRETGPGMGTRRETGPGMGLREYVGALEQAVIETVAEFGIEAGRVAGKTGVWVDDSKVAGRRVGRRVGSGFDHAEERGESKICAIGIRASRGVVMHGLALNVATDLGWFEWINPCGTAGAAVTSIEREAGRRVETEEVKAALGRRVAANLGVIINK